MVLGRLRDIIQGEPTLPPGPIHLPNYFPVEPAGCEKKAKALFECINSEATQKHRELEKNGEHLPHYQIRNNTTTEEDHSPEKDPLEPCRSLVAHYKRCCDRALKKKKNWKLTEPFRVQEEYRYKAKEENPDVSTK